MTSHRHEAAYLLRRYAELRRDEGKVDGPEHGWEAAELIRVLRFVAEAFGLEFTPGEPCR